MASETAQPVEALVARTITYGSDRGRFLVLCPAQGVLWVDDPAAATVFPSLSDAIRASFGLPGGVTAYSVLRQHELKHHKQF